MNELLKNWVLLVGITVVVLFCDRLAFSQEQTSSDVMELETEVGVDQIKPGGSLKLPAAKPKASPETAKSKIKNVSGSDTQSAPQDFAGEEGIKPRQQYDESMPSAEHRMKQASASAPQDAQEDPKDEVNVDPIKPENMITDTQVIELSESLRKLIEENDGLKKEINDLDTQLKNLKGQKTLDSKRMTEITIERDALRKQTENIADSNNKYETEMGQLKQQMNDKEQDYLKRIRALEEEVRKTIEASKVAEVSCESEPVESVSPVARPVLPAPVTTGQPQSRRSVKVDLTPNFKETQKRTNELSDSYQKLLEQKKKMTLDEAKIHYNMGNTYFGQGDYFNAVKEYQIAVKLAPEDASAHYNLAFVSGEFLHDYKKAVKHYRQYLFLNPVASDADIVRQKIINFEIELKGEVNFESDMNKTLINLKNEAHEM